MSILAKCRECGRENAHSIKPTHEVCARCVRKYKEAKELEKQVDTTNQNQE